MDNKSYHFVRTLFGTVLALSIATLGITAAVGGTSAMWVRGSIATAIAALLLVLAGRARRGSRGAWRRMRLMAALAPVGVAAIVAVPHDGFPAWMKAEQAVLGLLLIAASVVLHNAAGAKAPRGTSARAGAGC